MFIRLRQLLRRGRGQEGAVAVEFALILPVLIFLILGGMDIGHMFYIEYLVTNASREGARYGAKYTGTPPVDPTSAQISAFAKSMIPALDGLVVQDPVYTTVTATPNYRIITITVTAPKYWWVLATFHFYGWVPFPNPKTITATTAMRVEY